MLKTRGVHHVHIAAHSPATRRRQFKSKSNALNQHTPARVLQTGVPGAIEISQRLHCDHCDTADPSRRAVAAAAAVDYATWDSHRTTVIAPHAPPLFLSLSQLFSLHGAAFCHTPRARYNDKSAVTSRSHDSASNHNPRPIICL